MFRITSIALTGGAMLCGKTAAGPHGDFIHQFDSLVGDLLDTLEKLGVADNTLVMLCSDTGPGQMNALRALLGALLLTCCSARAGNAASSYAAIVQQHVRGLQP